MARQPVTLPAALDKLEDAIAAIERRVPALERAVEQYEKVLAATPIEQQNVFCEDIKSLWSRLANVKHRIEAAQ